MGVVEEVREAVGNVRGGDRVPPLPFNVACGTCTPQSACSAAADVRRFAERE